MSIAEKRKVKAVWSIIGSAVGALLATFVPEVFQAVCSGG